MAHQFNQTKPIGGMDMDSEVRNLAPIDYLYGKNIRNAINELNKGGTLTSVRGNVQITKYNLPYNKLTSLPSGRNVCIGAFEDEKYNTVIFCVWNSNKQHQILRYYRNNTDPTNPYGEVQQIIGYDFSNWTKQTRITSGNIVYNSISAGGTGDLFYWCDPIPKKINLEKANICEKFKSWNVVLPKGYANSSFFFQIVVRNFLTNGVVASANINIAPNQTIEQMLASLATQVNASLGTYLNAEACDCSATITEKSVNGYNITFTSTAFYVIPENWYGLTLIDRFWDRCKWQPMNAPQAEYKQDADFLPNYVQSKVFQFRLEYDYDDKEESALGVWSQIPINNLACNGGSNQALNYIDVNFNDPDLLNVATLVLLKSVKVIVRELNTGADKEVITLSPCEFLDRQNNAIIAHFDFYNNIISNTVDAATAAKPFNNVPREVNAEQFTKNRMVEGGIKEGYDAPECISADYTIDFAEEQNQKVYNITGMIRIFNPKMDNMSDYPPQPTNPGILERRSAILYDTTMVDTGQTAYPFFGGSYYSNNNIEINSDWAYKKKKNILVEGGFPVYLAGTDIFTISKQIARNDVAQLADGSFDISTTVNKDKVEKLYKDFEIALDPQYDVFSTFTLRGVPAGEYVIRIASHWCSFGDKLGKGFQYDLSAGRAYQSTSTYVWGVNDFGIGGTYRYDYEIKVTVTNSDVFVGEFIVADTIIPFGNDDVNVYPTHCGYLIDANGLVDVPSLNRGVTVERALVRNSRFTGSSNLSYYQQKITDHNGFWYVFPAADLNNDLAIANRYEVYQLNGAGTTGLIHNSGTQYYGVDGGESSLYLLSQETITTNYDVTSNILDIIIPTDTPNARAGSSTFIQGTVVDNTGQPIPNVPIVFTHGRTVTTALDGTFSLLAWNDMMFTTNLSARVNKREDYLIFQQTIFCFPTYPNGQTVYVLITNFGTGAGQYNPSNPYVIPNFVINDNNNPDIKALKRGGNYLYGLRLSDDAGRLTTVVPTFEIYVPFITEDLNKSLPDQYAPNTYKYGKPSINWSLAANTAFPTWAAKATWMRTKNLIYGRYLQWVANSVTYLSAVAQGTIPEQVTTFANQDAIAIKISLTNIAIFGSQNPNSQIGYNFQEGDRVRVIANRDLVNVQGIYDFEIISYDASKQELIVKSDNNAIEIQSGSIIEVLNVKTVADTDQQLYFEVGEDIEVVNGIPQQLSGTFTNGDTYWRGRVVPVNDDQENFASSYQVVIEDASVSDFYPSLAEDIGRVGVVDPNFKEIYRPMLMRFSNQFIPSTALNGLSSFEALNAKELDRADGQIQRFVFTQNNLVVITSRREVSNYINRITAYQADSNSGVLSLADSFLGTDYIHSQQLGTDLPASIVEFSGKIFGWTNYMGNVWKYQGDGEQVLSDVKMTNFFKALSDGGVSDAVAVYDRYHEEYVLTYWKDYTVNSQVVAIGKLPSGYSLGITVPLDSILPELNTDATIQYRNGSKWVTAAATITSIVTRENDILITVNTADNFRFTVGIAIALTYTAPETVCWFEGNQFYQGGRWSSFYSFTPENYCALGDEVVAFRNGSIWIQDKDAIHNRFFGTQYTTQIQPVFNMQPDYLKVWNSCILKQKQDDNANNWEAIDITNDNGQRSRLKQGSWVKKGEHWYGAFKRDMNDLTVPSNLAITQGRALRSTSLSVLLESNYTGDMKLWAWDANWTYSERTTK